MLSKRLNDITPSFAIGISNKVQKLREEGIDIINLSIGEPDFFTPYKAKEEAIKAIHNNKKISHKKIKLPEYSFRIPEMKIIPRETAYREKKNVPFLESRGKISGEYIIPYPPGTPIICPGEIITEEVIEYVEILKDMGLDIIGMSDKKLDTINVIT